MKIIQAGQSGKECRELVIVISDALRARGIENDPWGEHICLPLGKFNVEGPYGTHLCLVYPVLGPPVSFAFRIYYEDVDSDEGDEEQNEEDGDEEDQDEDDDGAMEEELVGLCRQTVQAVSALHRLGVGHGGKSSLSSEQLLIKDKSLNLATRLTASECTSWSAIS